MEPLVHSNSKIQPSKLSLTPARAPEGLVRRAGPLHTFSLPDTGSDTQFLTPGNSHASPLEAQSPRIYMALDDFMGLEMCPWQLNLSSGQTNQD